MPQIARPPCVALSPWVQLLWATTGDASDLPAPYLERVLPTGVMHVVVRLSGSPLTLFDDAGAERSHLVGHGIVGGARSASYVKRAGDSACSVGVQLKPDAALALLGAPGVELAERHTSLEDVWGAGAQRLREHLAHVHQRALIAAHGAASLDAVLRALADAFEASLLSRLRPGAAPDAWLAGAVAKLEKGTSLNEIVAASGVSHRTFITRFRQAVGLTPKVYGRVRRFQRVTTALTHLASPAGDSGLSRRQRQLVSLAHVALDAGYADQAHLCRDFGEFAKVSPSAYMRSAPANANHLRLRP